MTDGHLNITGLVEQWMTARQRTFEARSLLGLVQQPADYWTELETATAISQEVLSGRWSAVASLLRLGAVKSWSQVGRALDMTETEAHAGFVTWLDEQVALFRRTQVAGLSGAEAAELGTLADRSVPL